MAATWATVGFLFFEEKDELIAHIPETLPEYTNRDLSPYYDIDRLGCDERNSPYHFARSLVREIAAAPSQEIASHTFSHYYCLEEGQTAAAFAADLAAAQRAAALLGVELESLVFPRNQFNPEYLAICAAAGFKSVRGNPASWIYPPPDRPADSRVRRLGRLCDSYTPFFGNMAAPAHEIAPGLVNVPSSIFLRPSGQQSWSSENWRYDRIMRGLDAAAGSNSIFHLWWHPHNFGVDTDANLAFLERILTYFAHLAETTGMRSMTMAEVAAR
jgi:hypothetical protein